MSRIKEAIFLRAEEDFANAQPWNESLPDRMQRLYRALTQLEEVAGVPEAITRDLEESLCDAFNEYHAAQRQYRSLTRRLQRAGRWSVQK